MAVHLEIPIAKSEIQKLRVGESVFLSGVMITGRDAVHKWIDDTFIHPTRVTTAEDRGVLDQIIPVVAEGVIFHCGPVISGLDTKEYSIIAAGPTTSKREEPFQADVIRFLNLRGVIGKGGMGQNTLNACKEAPAVYFSAVGGAASLTAKCIKRVWGVYKLELGVPEAIWVIEVKDLPLIVTMDSQGNSLHASVRSRSKEVLDRLLA